MSLDSILNVLVPAGIFIAIFVWIYIQWQRPLDRFFSKIKEKIRGKGEGGEDDGGGTYGIDYRPVGTYEYNSNY